MGLRREALCLEWMARQVPTATSHPAHITPTLADKAESQLLQLESDHSWNWLGRGVPFLHDDLCEGPVPDPEACYAQQTASLPEHWSDPAHWQGPSPNQPSRNHSSPLLSKVPRLQPNHPVFFKELLWGEGFH